MYQMLGVMTPEERIRFYYANSEVAKERYNPVLDIMGRIVSLEWKKFKNLPPVQDIDLESFGLAAGFVSRGVS
jgi:hypothetical protein